MLKKILVASLVVGLLASVAPQRASAEVVNEIVLRVNERIATLYDYLLRRAEYRNLILGDERLSADEQERRLAEIPRLAMQEIFQKLLLDSRAEQLEIYVTNEEIEDSLLKMRERMGIRSDDELTEALSQAGMTVDQLKAQYEARIRQDKVIGQEVWPNVKVDEDELRRYYRAHPEEFEIAEKVQTREIVVLETVTLDEATRLQLAQDLVARLRGGESLEEVAAEYQDAGDTSGVIDLGWVNPGDLDSALEGALWALEVGGFSDPVAGRGGFHLLELVDREEATVRPFSEVKARLKAREQDRMATEMVAEYMQELARTAHIVERIPPDAIGYRDATVAPVREPFQVIEAAEEAAEATKDAAPALEVEAADP